MELHSIMEVNNRTDKQIYLTINLFVSKIYIKFKLWQIKRKQPE